MSAPASRSVALGELIEKRALVCGSTQGIGRACAEGLARLGARITLFARNESTLRVVRDALPTVRAGPHDYLCADFADPTAVRDAAVRHVEATGPIHILINNTGGPPGGPVLDASTEQFLAAFQSHLICNQLLAQALVPGMKAAGYGRIINIISTSVRQPIMGLGVSNATRGAVASWAKTLAGEVGPFGITVNNVLPGFTDTQRLRSLITARAKAARQSEREIEAGLMAEVPLRRFGSAAEVAAAAAFFASPAASYVSGVSLQVDGGRTTSI